MIIMEITNLVTLLDSHFTRMVRSIRTSGQELISWEVGDQTVTVNETEIDRCARICLKNTEDTVCLYLAYIFRDDERFNRHYHKFILSEVESIGIEP